MITGKIFTHANVIIKIVGLGLDIVYPVMGEDFALNCSFSANPSVSAGVIWYKNGNPVDFQTTPHKNITQDGSVIQIIKCKSLEDF